MTPDPIQPWLERWRLVPDGEAFTTRFGSRLAPVRTAEGAAAMLKIAGHPEEARGGLLMAWWAGDGAAEVLAHDGDAILLERLEGGRALAAMALGGEDDEATRILCDVAARLHAPRPAAAPSSLVPLDAWFAALFEVAPREGGLFARAAPVARALLADPHDAVVLHGDLHHDNVLDFGPRGWLAIDPKGLIGERAFDFANIFCNPWPIAAEAGRLRQRLALVSEAAKVERGRLLQWIVAYAGLSAAWTLESGGDPSRALRIVEIASAET